ncbi:MAG: alpha/beta fold hydrolase [Erysipelotrichales bacterium]|nr:alpha/beta fold hydrolase [Erysipelotrichales bacterium]
MTEEKIILNKEGEYPLNGKLTFPDKIEVPCPAVVFVHGSGSSNMDEKIVSVTPFKDLAQGLAEYGVASIRYDKRTFAHGKKMMKDKSKIITIKEETIDDCLSAVEYIRKDPRIDPNRVYIVGHSMGAMLAPRIDAEGGNFAGLIMLAGTPRKLEEIVIDQLTQALEIMHPFLKFLSQGKIRKMIKNFDGLYELSDEEAKKIKYAGGITMYYFKEMGEHPTPMYLEKTFKPMLILQGEDDIQVSVERDFQEYQRLLEGRANVTYRVYTGLNHAFVQSQGSTILNATKEFSKAQNIGENVICDIANWIQEQE